MVTILYSLLNRQNNLQSQNTSTRKKWVFNIIFNKLKKKQKQQFNKDPSIVLYTDLNTVV